MNGSRWSPGAPELNERSSTIHEVAGTHSRNGVADQHEPVTSERRKLRTSLVTNLERTATPVLSMRGGDMSCVGSLQATDIIKSAHSTLAKKLQQATPHWMRRSHASHAVARGAGLTTIFGNLCAMSASMYQRGDDILRAGETNQAFERR
ncbi:hypothetical protein [Burkholderia sp. TSV86]|uniref:hypothetical protein n=1 Tax=Burkholderia sp. TSV86 TaxID=1385594 RepID=UPI0018D222D9|nr:hypothetical protein [Burkholderia sp. TSV86]